MSPGLINPFAVAPSGPALPRTNLATNPRCNQLNTNAKNEVGPTNFYWHGNYSASGSGGPSSVGEPAPASYVVKTLNISSPAPTDTKINIMNQNPDSSPLSPSLEGLDVIQNTAYTLSFWLALSKTCTPSFKVKEFNSSGAFLYYPEYLFNLATTGFWTRCFLTFTTGASTAIISGNIGATDGSWANGDYFAISGILLEQTNLLGTYFDGSMAGCSWVGATDDSRSTKTS